MAIRPLTPERCGARRPLDLGAETAICSRPAGHDSLDHPAFYRLHMQYGGPTWDAPQLHGRQPWDRSAMEYQTGEQPRIPLPARALPGLARLLTLIRLSNPLVRLAATIATILGVLTLLVLVLAG